MLHFQHKLILATILLLPESTSKKLDEAIKNGNTVYSRFAPYIKDKNKFIKLFNKMTLGMTPAVLYFQSRQNETKE